MKFDIFKVWKNPKVDLRIWKQVYALIKNFNALQVIKPLKLWNKILQKVSWEAQVSAVVSHFLNQRLVLSMEINPVTNVVIGLNTHLARLNHVKDLVAFLDPIEFTSLNLWSIVAFEELANPNGFKVGILTTL